MVGHQTLDLGAVVRAHLPQPLITEDNERFKPWRNRIVVNSAGSQSANGGSIPPCATSLILRIIFPNYPGGAGKTCFFLIFR